MRPHPRQNDVQALARLAKGHMLLPLGILRVPEPQEHLAQLFVSTLFHGLSAFTNALPTRAQVHGISRLRHASSCRSTSAGAVEPALRNAARAFATPRPLYASAPRPGRTPS